MRTTQSSAARTSYWFNDERFYAVAELIDVLSGGRVLRRTAESLVANRIERSSS